MLEILSTTWEDEILSTGSFFNMSMIISYMGCCAIPAMKAKHKIQFFIKIRFRKWNIPFRLTGVSLRMFFGMSYNLP
jgi:hypothetical protein